MWTRKAIHRKCSAVECLECSEVKCKKVPDDKSTWYKYRYMQNILKYSNMYVYT